MELKYGELKRKKTQLDLKAQMAKKILRDDIAVIPDVKTWAGKLGVSTRWLSKIVKQEFGSSPKEMLRMRRIMLYLLKCNTISIIRSTY